MLRQKEVILSHMVPDSGCYTSRFPTISLESPTKIYFPSLRLKFQNSKNVSNIKISSKCSPTCFHRSGLAGVNERVSGQNN